MATTIQHTYMWASQVVPVVKNPPASTGDIRDMDSIPGPGRSPGEENGNPLQYSCLENPMDRRAWWATVYSVAELDMTEWPTLSIMLPWDIKYSSLCYTVDCGWLSILYIVMCICSSQNFFHTLNPWGWYSLSPQSLPEFCPGLLPTVFPIGLGRHPKQGRVGIWTKTLWKIRGSPKYTQGVVRAGLWTNTGWVLQPSSSPAPWAALLPHDSGPNCVTDSPSICHFHPTRQPTSHCHIWGHGMSTLQDWRPIYRMPRRAHSPSIAAG